MSAIQTVIARELCDAQGRLAVEAEVVTESGATGRAVVALGVDSDTHPVPTRAVEVVLGQSVQGMDSLDQAGVDRVLAGTDDSYAGNDARLAVSLAVARAAAESVELPLWRYLGGAAARVLPTPSIAVPSGTTGGVRILLVPRGAPSFGDALRTAGAVLRCIENSVPLVVQDGDPTTLLADALALATRAIEATDSEPGEDVALGLDVRGDAIWDQTREVYRWPGGSLSAEELARCLDDVRRRFPLLTVVHPCTRDDADGWAALVARVGADLQLVADGAMSETPEGIEAITICPDAMGSVSGTLEALRTAREAGLLPVVARHDRDTEDSFLADLAVATNAGQILAGTFAEGSARYNQLARIAWALGGGAIYAGPVPFRR